MDSTQSDNQKNSAYVLNGLLQLSATTWNHLATSNLHIILYANTKPTALITATVSSSSSLTYLWTYMSLL